MDANYYNGEPGASDSDYDEGGVCFESEPAQGLGSCDEDDYGDFDPEAEAADEAYERWLERIA